MLFELHQGEDILDDGTLQYDAAVKVEAESVADLARKIEEGEFKEFHGVEIVSVVNLDDTELSVTFLMPFDLTMEYRFIEGSSASDRRFTGFGEEEEQ